MSEESEIIENEEVITNESEAKAREMGWAPQEEWRGDPNKWVNANEFLERGYQSNGILRERNEKLIGEIETLKSELRGFVREQGEATRKAEDRAYKKALNDVRKQQEQAVEEGDTEAWKQLETHKESLQDEYVKSRQQQHEQAKNYDVDPTYQAWATENHWYNSDVEATAYAEQIAQVIGRRHGGQPTRAFYDDIASEVRKKFPEKFRNPNRDEPSPVEGARQSGGRSKKGKNYSDLPPEAKAACDKFVKQGILKKEDYVKEYFGE